ncbi:hypothetical protein ESCO_006681 [Escovopsis weberi]|uniref:Tat pathway signal sequence n=1 Tax=Escovopsis weberi TaxID=150374 RepID=A0A0M9VXP2_ESCWE|nr:hypothetical protein ESCO_006681 [Escovopsis weberi]
MMLGDIKLDSPSVQGLDTEQDTSSWNREHRRRRCRFVGLLTFLVVITLGLGVGLSLGLSYSGMSNGEGTEFGDASMTGSFSFDTTLQQISTGCTSNPTTWRCFPYSSGVVTEFQWAIKQDEDDDYSISSLSTASPASHAFSNVPLTLLDSSLTTERFVFSFQMNKTVVPSAALASSSFSSSSSPSPSKPSHASSCTYTNATFQGTLWTRRASLRHRPKALQRRQDGEFPAWPGLIEITELVDSRKGSMACHDSEGVEIGGMRAVEGTCGCLYRTPERP